jgi:hypothetical protein
MENNVADINYSVKIQFDGKDAEQHEIELFALGDSLKGIARIAAVSGNFAATQKYSRYFSTHEVRVFAREPRANCFSMELVWNFVQQHQILSGSFGAIAAGIIALVLASAANKKAEVSELKDSLDKTVKLLADNNIQTTALLTSTIERIVEDMKPSARLAVAPIGTSCRTMSIKSPYYEIVLDEDDKAEIIKDSLEDITDLRAYTLVITELDLERGTCKVHIDGELEAARTNAVITDPILQSVNNPYSLALSSGEKINVVAKALLKNGAISLLYISDIGF